MLLEWIKQTASICWNHTRKSLKFDGDKGDKVNAARNETQAPLTKP